MRISALALVLLGLLAAGCETVHHVHILDRGWASPEQTFQTFRAAMLAERPDLVYACLSPGFKEREGVPGEREFKAGFKQYRSDFEQFADVLERARVTDVRYALVTGDEVPALKGRMIAKLAISMQDMEAEFILVDLPVSRISVRLPEYEPMEVARYLPGADFSSVLDVDAGTVRIRPLDWSETGVTEIHEIDAIGFSHHWLLEDLLKLPIDVSALMKRLSAAGARP